MKVYRDTYQPRPYFIDPVVILNKRTVTESWLNKFTFYNNGESYANLSALQFRYYML